MPGSTEGYVADDVLFGALAPRGVDLPVLYPDLEQLDPGRLGLKNWFMGFKVGDVTYSGTPEWGVRKHILPKQWTQLGEQIPLRSSGRYSDVRAEAAALLKALEEGKAKVADDEISIDPQVLEAGAGDKQPVRVPWGQAPQGGTAWLRAYHCAAIEAMIKETEESGPGSAPLGRWHMVTFRRKLILKRPGGQTLQTSRGQEVRKAVLLSADGAPLGWAGAE